MDKKTILVITVVILIIIGLGTGIFLYLDRQKKIKPVIKTIQKAGQPEEIITEGALKGVLPSIETNPLKNKPDINPADKANPFKNIKLNPFE
jgi:preprotein translocase subunit YajC